MNNYAIKQANKAARKAKKAAEREARKQGGKVAKAVRHEWTARRFTAEAMLAQG